MPQQGQYWRDRARIWAYWSLQNVWAPQVVVVVKNPPASAGATRHRFSPWVSRVPWGRRRQPSQHSCLGNPMDRRAWRATVHGVTKNRTGLKGWIPHHHHPEKKRGVQNGSKVSSSCFSLWGIKKKVTIFLAGENSGGGELSGKKKRVVF